MINFKFLAHVAKILFTFSSNGNTMVSYIRTQIMDCATVCSSPRFITMHQTQIKSCENTLPLPEGELFRIWTKRIRAVAFRCHKTSEFLNLFVC